MEYAFVHTNLLDMWAEPSFEAERVNQLLWGEVVEIVSENNDGFLSVRQGDGYTGWVDGRLLKTTSSEDSESYNSGRNWIVGELTTPLIDFEPPYYLYYGTKLRGDKEESGSVVCSLADGYSFKLMTRHLHRIIEPDKETQIGAAVVEEAKKFLGVPYLWGGISAAGLDCSGLVRLVYGQYGFDMPRDTKDQVNCGEMIDRNETRTGDLLFFKRHVAIDMGNGRIIHSSRAEGGVRISSLDPSDDNFRRDLNETFVCARRIA